MTNKDLADALVANPPLRRLVVAVREHAQGHRSPLMCGVCEAWLVYFEHTCDQLRLNDLHGWNCD